MSLTEDRTVFFADYGVTATIGGLPVEVIFDNEFLASMDVESTNPVALAQTADVVAVPRDTAITIPAGKFSEAFTGTIVGNQPNGTGFSVLELAES